MARIKIHHLNLLYAGFPRPLATFRSIVGSTAAGVPAAVAIAVVDSFDLEDFLVALFTGRELA